MSGSVQLPAFARGLRITRFAVFLVLAQLALSLVLSVKSFAASSPDDALEAFKWLRYLLIANLGSAVAMLAGALISLPELRRVHVPVRALGFAIVAFGIAVAASWWSYHVLTSFIALVLDPGSSGADELAAVVDDLSSLRWVTILKDLSCILGLIAVVRVVRASAAASDQLALRDLASTQTGALILLCLADGFYQVTYGLGGGGGLPMVGFAASLLVLGYWIRCHLQLARFLESAAYFVNEPHAIPMARVIHAPTLADSPRPAARTSVPAVSVAPIVPLATERPAAPVPRAEPAVEDPADVPRFLR